VTQASFLSGERILLRALTEADCTGPYLNWFNDAEVCRYNTHHRFPFSLEDALAYIRRTQQSTTDLVLAIIQRKDNRHIGNVSLQQIDFVSQAAEFAIVIGEKDCWGKGYSKEAAVLLLNHAFLSLHLHRIHCGTTQDNVPMQRLALFLGMKEEGRRREALFKEGQYLDILEYGLLKEEYLGRFRALGQQQVLQGQPVR